MVYWCKYATVITDHNTALELQETYYRAINNRNCGWIDMWLELILYSKAYSRT